MCLERLGEWSGNSVEWNVLFSVNIYLSMKKHKNVWQKKVVTKLISRIKYFSSDLCRVGIYGPIQENCIANLFTYFIGIEINFGELQTLEIQMLMYACMYNVCMHYPQFLQENHSTLSTWNNYTALLYTFVYFTRCQWICLSVYAYWQFCVINSISKCLAFESPRVEYENFNTNIKL